MSFSNWDRLMPDPLPAVGLVVFSSHLCTLCELQTGADREVQRILMELLNQMDGFDQTVNVKVRAWARQGGWE